MESTPSYFYFIYTPRGYKLQINNFSALMFINDDRPFPVKAVAPAVKAGGKLSSAEFMEALKEKIWGVLCEKESGSDLNFLEEFVDC